MRPEQIQLSGLSRLTQIERSHLDHWLREYSWRITIAVCTSTYPTLWEEVSGELVDGIREKTAG